MRWSRGLEVRYVQAGTSALPSQASWPLAWFEVVGQEARAKLFRTGVTITNEISVTVTAPDAQFGAAARRTELQFDLIDQTAGLARVELLISESGRAREVVDALREAGFELTGGPSHD